jgi:RNA polymerase sigma-70 factor, ECF subfamily
LERARSNAWASRIPGQHHHDEVSALPTNCLRRDLDLTKQTENKMMLAAEIFEKERGHLFAVAYRMLASRSEAEDVVQEAWLRFAEQSPQHEHLESTRAYLTTIVVRLSLDQMKSARSRRETYVGPWLPEPIAAANSNTMPLPETPESRAELAESLSLAFLVVLERLSPLERAAFLLREVFDHSFEEVAAILGTTEDASRKLVTRARAHVDEGRARFTAPAEKKAELLQAFVAACSSGDTNALQQLLATDVVARSDGGGKVIAALRPILGPDRVSRFLMGAMKKFPPGAWPELVPINGELGILLRDDALVRTVLTLSVRDGLIADIFLVNNPDKLARIARDLGIGVRTTH